MNESAARFKAGDPVKVRSGDRLGHIRTPCYIRGKTGWIERIHGEFLNPESLAFGGSGLPKKTLYLVAFNQADVWPECAGAGDKVLVDIYDHWLDAAPSGGSHE